MCFQGFAHARTPRVLHFSGILLTLGAHAQEGYSSWVCGSVCLSVKSHLTSGASVRPENTVVYSAGNGGQKFVGFSLKPLCSRVMA